MKKQFLFSTFILVILSSCNWAKDKAKETVNKTGEIVAKTGSEFVNGVAKGVEKTFTNVVELSPALVAKGLKTGKIIINSTDSTSDNILSVYFIFDNDFSATVVAKVLDENGVEYGRTKSVIAGKKSDAQYFDFNFDKRTNIDSKGKIVFE